MTYIVLQYTKHRIFFAGASCEVSMDRLVIDGWGKYIGTDHEQIVVKERKDGTNTVVHRCIETGAGMQTVQDGMDFRALPRKMRIERMLSCRGASKMGKGKKLKSSSVTADFEKFENFFYQDSHVFGIITCIADSMSESGLSFIHSDRAIQSRRITWSLNIRWIPWSRSLLLRTSHTREQACRLHMGHIPSPAAHGGSLT